VIQYRRQDDSTEAAPEKGTKDTEKVTSTNKGSFLDAVFSVCTNRSTIEGYAIAFRKVVADIFGLTTDPAKFDYQSGGRDEWLAKIHGIRLSKITPARIQEWKQSFLAAAGDDPLALRKARISVNTLLRRSRSLFSPKVLRQLPLSLPSPLPFDGVEFEPRQSMKYRSNFNVLDLITAIVASARLCFLAEEFLLAASSRMIALSGATKAGTESAQDQSNGASLSTHSPL
jgi:hypothetical protein